jgi:hypothetical protein
LIGVLIEAEVIGVENIGGREGILGVPILTKYWNSWYSFERIMRG